MIWEELSIEYLMHPLHLQTLFIKSAGGHIKF
jgi:hypothetical protein